MTFGQGCPEIPQATLVDLTGDMSAVLGLPEPTGDAELLGCGVHVEVPTLRRAAVPVGGVDLDLITANRLPDERFCSDWDQLAERLSQDPRTFFVDAGTVVGLPLHSDQRLLVTRHCYIALRHATRVG